MLKHRRGEMTSSTFKCRPALPRSLHLLNPSFLQLESSSESLCEPHSFLLQNEYQIRFKIISQAYILHQEKTCLCFYTWEASDVTAVCCTESETSDRFESFLEEETLLILLVIGKVCIVDFSSPPTCRQLRKHGIFCPRVSMPVMKGSADQRSR